MTRDFLWCLLFRLSSVFIIQTSYVPDEYWQSLEVAHEIVFGYGFLTWEWRHQLRSHTYPFLFVMLYSILKFLHLDFPIFIILFPRILQAFLTSLSDYYFLQWCKYFHMKPLWTNLALFTNWFWYYCGSRTLVNTFETSISTIALYFYPWSLFKPNVKEKQSLKKENFLSIKRQSAIYLTLVAVNCVSRPTAVLMWCPLVLCQLWYINFKYLKNFLLTVFLPVGFTVLFFSILIDFFFYKSITFPPYNFLVSNIFHGVASFYGTHPFSWYLTQGIPVVMGLLILPFVAESLQFIFGKSYGLEKILFNVIFCTVILNLIMFSFIPHKEFRFILPLTPLMTFIAVKFMSHQYYLNNFYSIKYIWIILMVASFVIPTMIFGVYHQQGTLKAVDFLSTVASKNPNSSFLFLMPCHSTPLYSHIHTNVSTKFLTCEPPLSSNHYDESEDFFENPTLWLQNFWDDSKPPTHIICFDTISFNVLDFLKTKGFNIHSINKTFMFPHTFFPEGRVGHNVVVYEK